MSAMPLELSNDIDYLLQRYLELTDHYCSLREELIVAQRAFYQNIARANLAADRGISRYGADRYDERTQASLRCQITVSSISNSRLGMMDTESDVEETRETIQEIESLPETSTSVPTTHLQIVTKASSESTSNPILMFAALPPPTLRSAQKNAVDMVSTIPRLVSVDREMQEIEIRVRRARKYRLKVEASESSGGMSKIEESGTSMEQLLEEVRKTTIA